MPGAPPARTLPRTVLVVEDNPDHALLVQIAAHRALPDLDVRIVGDGLEAVAYLEGRAPYDDRRVHPIPGLVILDLMLPRLDGFGVLEWIRARGGAVRLPVVVLTSSNSPRDEKRALQMGASAFHSKTADMDRMGDQVRDIVARWLA